MKNQTFLKPFSKSAFLIILIISMAVGQEADLKARFDAEYQAWKTGVEAKGSSSMPEYNSHLFEIVKMGVPVLPYLIEKMEKQEYILDFLLASAFFRITQKRFHREDVPEGGIPGDARIQASMYIDWWHNGIMNTPVDFDRYYKEWKKAMAEDNDKVAQKNLRCCFMLGIAAIPFMIEKIEAGDSEFIKIISDLTDGNLSENAGKDECLSWWNENKERYTIKIAE